MNHHYIFESLDRHEWFCNICRIRNLHCDSSSDSITFDFGDDIKIDSFRPEHLVTYACLIHCLIENGNRVLQGTNNSEVAQYIYDDLGLKNYFTLGSNHVASKDPTIFNLWRIKESEIETYSPRVSSYFKQNMFGGKDLSPVQESLVESYYNVFDHAEAKGNAFSLVQYVKDEERIHIAIADFGKGIPASVMNFDPSIVDDLSALKKAVEFRFTVGSRVHNSGRGLNNILDLSSNTHIISGSAMVCKKDNEIHSYSLDFCFSGTLIYYDIDVNLLEDDDEMFEFVIC